MVDHREHPSAGVSEWSTIDGCLFSWASGPGEKSIGVVTGSRNRPAGLAMGGPAAVSRVAARVSGAWCAGAEAVTAAVVVSGPESRQRTRDDPGFLRATYPRSSTASATAAGSTPAPGRCVQRVAAGRRRRVPRASRPTSARPVEVLAGAPDVRQPQPPSSDDVGATSGLVPATPPAPAPPFPAPAMPAPDMPAPAMPAPKIPISFMRHPTSAPSPPCWGIPW